MKGEPEKHSRSLVESPLRVCFFAHSGGLGGASLALSELIRGMEENRWEIHAVVPSDRAFAALLRDGDTTVHVIRYGRWTGMSTGIVRRLKRLARSLRGLIGAALLLRRIRPDVVVSNTLAVPAGAVAARLARIPHVWFIHEFGDRDHGVGFDFGKARTLRWIDRLSERVIVNSRAVRDAMAPYMDRSKLRLTYYAMELRTDVPTREPASTGALVLGMAGRLAPSKGQHHAIDALAILRKRGVVLDLHFLGTGPDGYIEELERRAEAAGVKEQVYFDGFSATPELWFQRFPVILVASRDEAFGRVTVEAMKLGAAVIGSKSGGTEELIRDGYNGLLFEPGDSEGLAACIETLDTDRDLLETLRSNAQHWALETFTLEKYLDGVASVLWEAVDSTPEARPGSTT